ncbi:MAG: FxsA family protein [Acidimicrobiales bacterium]
MAVVLALLFLVVPIAELYLIVQTAQAFGVLETIALLIVVSALGGWLVKREGLGLLARIQGQLKRGELPGASLVDGFLVLFAGALLLTPGFLTDLLGIALLLPPVRAAVRTVLMRRFRHRVAVRVERAAGFDRFERFGGGPVVDADVVDANLVDANPVDADRVDDPAREAPKGPLPPGR